MTDERELKLLRNIEKLVVQRQELRDALRSIAEGDTPKRHAEMWRDDGKPSKHDKCPHGRFMYEDCEQCVEEYAAAFLASGIETEGGNEVPSRSDESADPKGFAQKDPA